MLDNKQGQLQPNIKTIVQDQGGHLQDKHVFSTTVSIGATYVYEDKIWEDFLPLEPLTNVPCRALADKMP